MFVIFSGVSSSGKNTIMNNLTKTRPNTYILDKSSGTTRVPRESDKENSTYIFMNKEEFENLIKNDQLFEYEFVHGNYYGLLKSALQRVIDNPQNVYMRDVDVNGNTKLKKYFEGKGKVVSIFLDAPDEELVKRLRARGEDEDRIKVRLSRGEYERSKKNEYDLVIDNRDIETTTQIICDFLNKIESENK